MPLNHYRLSKPIRYLLLFSILFSSICFGQKSKNTQDDVKYQKMARDIFRELIEINTTTSKGSTVAAEAMAARLRDEVRIPVEQIVASMWPGVKVSPVMSTGASDSKYLRRAGIPVYGISGMFTDMDDVRAHGKDERIGVDDFYQGVEFMYKFIKEVSIAAGLSHR